MRRQQTGKRLLSGTVRGVNISSLKRPDSREDRTNAWAGMRSPVCVQSSCADLLAERRGEAGGGEGGQTWGEGTAFSADLTMKMSLLQHLNELQVVGVEETSKNSSGFSPDAILGHLCSGTVFLGSFPYSRPRCAWIVRGRQSYLSCDLLIFPKTGKAFVS